MTDYPHAASAPPARHPVHPRLNATEPDPRHVFLTAGEVIARYRWGRTKGYQQLRDGNFPKPVAGRYRLDLLMAWEDEQLAAASAPALMRPAGPPEKRRPSRRASA